MDIKEKESKIVNDGVSEQRNWCFFFIAVGYLLTSCSESGIEKSYNLVLRARVVIDEPSSETELFAYRAAARDIAAGSFSLEAKVEQGSIEVFKPASGVNISSGMRTVTTDASGRCIFLGSMEELENADFSIGDIGARLDSKRVTREVVGDTIQLTYTVNRSEISCDEETLLGAVGPELREAGQDTKSLGGTWDGVTQGRACLDDNGPGSTMTTSGSYFYSDCISAPWSTFCLIDYLWVEHGCYHHQGNQTCSVAQQHSQERHLHN